MGAERDVNVGGPGPDPPRQVGHAHILPSRLLSLRDRRTMATMLTTPVTLLERLRRPDDPEAWGRFVELYTPLLYAWARKTGLQESDAADLVQEVFTLLLR